MKVLSVCLLVLIASLAELAQSRKLHLVGCTVGAHTGELRKYYNEMRTDVEDQTCCFLQLLLRFYIERVFSRYSSSGLEDQRSASALANAFFSIRRDLTPCLNVKLAAVKAVGELDTVLDWLEGFRRPGLTGHLGRK
ncbi:unnamed protein product [Merluccius merluccius]